MIGLWFLLGCMALSTLLLDLVYYAALTPDLRKPHSFARLSKHLSQCIYALSYGLGLLRIPFAAVPYLIKLLLFILLRQRFWSFWYLPSVQMLRLGGDFANLIVTALVIEHVPAGLPSGLVAILYASLFAEGVRIISEKLQTAVSGIWQLVPHKHIAASLGDVKLPALRRYAHYYVQSPEERAQQLLSFLKCSIWEDGEAVRKLGYLHSFRIVETSRSLRTGDVRDIALGEVYIHPSWTSDPWLLIGQALRRSPWIFDPRLVRRPLYYRTHTNRLCTLLVFDCGLYALPYAIYQFGHEIKVARYDAFYRVLKWIGYSLEEPVCANGISRNDPLLRWIGWLVGIREDMVTGPSMLTEMEMLCKIEAELREELLSALEVARRYAVPLCYVEDVVMVQVYSEKAWRINSATVRDASQWG